MRWVRVRIRVWVTFRVRVRNLKKSSLMDTCLEVLPLAAETGAAISGNGIATPDDLAGVCIDSAGLSIGSNLIFMAGQESILVADSGLKTMPSDV